MELYAVVECGAKQYRVKPGDKINVEKIKIEPDKETVLEKVLLVSDGKTVHIGKPYISGAKVICRVVSQIKDEKKVSFKFRRRKDSRTKVGHRQKLTKLEVKGISIAEVRSGA